MQFAFSFSFLFSISLVAGKIVFKAKSGKAIKPPNYVDY